MKAIERYFPLVQFILLHKVVLTSDSVKIFINYFSKYGLREWRVIWKIINKRKPTVSTAGNVLGYILTQVTTKIQFALNSGILGFVW